MKKITIKGELLEWWEQVGEARWRDLFQIYVHAARRLGHHPNTDYVGMTLQRILKKHGTKLGPSGSKALWKFNKEESSRSIDDLQVELKKLSDQLDEERSDREISEISTEAQIEDLVSDIKDLKSEIENLKSEVEELEDIKSDVSEVEDFRLEVEELKSSVESLEDANEDELEDNIKSILIKLLKNASFD